MSREKRLFTNNSELGGNGFSSTSTITIRHKDSNNRTRAENEKTG